MSSHMAPLHQAWAAFQARAPREKAMLLLALLALVLWLGDALFTGPAWAARQQARQQLEQAEKSLAELRAKLASDSAARELARRQASSEAAQLREQLAQLQARSTVPLDGPRTLALLEALVARQQGRLQLIGMTAMPDLKAGAAAAAVAPNGAPAVYRHGLQLVVAGPYEALHDYLRGLSREPQLRVQGFELQVREHPQLELVLRLETLSPQPAWLTL